MSKLALPFMDNSIKKFTLIRTQDGSDKHGAHLVPIEFFNDKIKWLNGILIIYTIYSA